MPAAGIHLVRRWTAADFPKYGKRSGDFIACTRRNGFFTSNRRRQNKYWMYETINEALRNSFYRDPDIEAALPDFERKVLGDRLSSFVAARKLLEMYFGDIRREK